MNKLNMIILAVSILNVAHAEDYSMYEEPNQDSEVESIDCTGYSSLEQRQNIQDTDCAIQYEIGDIGPAGGTVFYLVSGSNGTHGMESSPEETDRLSWGCLKTDIKGTGNRRIGEGKGNFNILIAEGCSPIANAVQEHSVNGFDDWYLGSRDEVALMLETIPTPEYTTGHIHYWSSSQYNNEVYPSWVEGGAYLVHFYNMDIKYHSGKGSLNKTRPIRNF